MVENGFINDPFIEKWSRAFDGTAGDETRYSRLIAKVNAEIRARGYLTRPTFIEIVNWKSPRIRPIFEKGDFRVYKRGLIHCLAENDDAKLSALVKLDGIGAPVGSAILHFIYPDRFPVMDIRTCEALYHHGLIGSRARDVKRYGDFRNAILDIQRGHPRWSLRDIDKALFAYHKFELSVRPDDP